MEKGSVVVVGALALACVLGAVIACGESNESKFVDDPEDAGFIPPPGSFDTDAGGDGGDGGAVRCPPSVPANYQAEWQTPQKATACSTGDIDAYYEACIAS